MKYYIDLDIAWDCPKEELEHLVEKHRMTIAICKDPCGPGGGNPIYRFYSRYKNRIKNFLYHDYCMGDKEHADWFATHIVEQT